MVKTLAGIVPSIPLELGFCSLQISHTSCCPFFVRVPPITTMGGYAGSCPSILRVLPIVGMGGYAGSCPSFLRVLPITGMGGCPGRCPFGLRVLPITGMGGRPFRLRVLPITGMGGHPFRLRVLPITGMGGRPFRLRVLPITGMGGRPGRCPVFLRILPVIITGRLPFFPLFFAGSSACKVRRGNLERGVTWNTAHSSASYSRTKTVRLASWDGIGRYTSALSYRGLQVSDSSFVGSFACILYSLRNQILQINSSDDSKLLTTAPCTSDYHLQLSGRPSKLAVKVWCLYLKATGNHMILSATFCMQIQ